MKKLVLFDLDGTLVDSLEDLADSANYALSQFGLPIHPTDPYRYFVGNGVDLLIRRAMPEDKREDETLFHQIKEVYSRRYSAHSGDKTRPYPGIAALLEKCRDKGVLTAVVSNKPHPNTVEVVAHYFPGFPFTAVLGQSADIPKKPDPTGVRKVLRDTGIDPGDALYVGDTWVDVETARNSGVESCGVLWGFRTREELVQSGASYIAADADELAKIIFSSGLDK